MTDEPFDTSGVVRTTAKTQRDRITELTAALANERALREQAQQEAGALAAYIQSRASSDGVWDHRDVMQLVADLAVKPLTDMIVRSENAQARGLPPSYAMFRALITNAYDNARARVMQRMGDQGEACGAINPDLVSDRMREDLRLASRMASPLSDAA